MEWLWILLSIGSIVLSMAVLVIVWVMTEHFHDEIDRLSSEVSFLEEELRGLKNESST